MLHERSRTQDECCVGPAREPPRGGRRRWGREGAQLLVGAVSTHEVRVPGTRW